LGALIANETSWPEVEAAISRGLIAVLPVGALEQHGPHLPLTTDTVLASGVAGRVAEATDALLLPAIAYGDAWTAEGSPRRRCAQRSPISVGACSAWG
jgi:creatinine amidohydrolase